MTMTDPQADRRRRRKAAKRVRPTEAELEATVGVSMFDVDLEPAAHARFSDPDTSHRAAEATKALTARQADVYACLLEHGPMADHDLVVAYARGVHDGHYVKQAASGIRTRRCELGDRTPPLVVDTGRKVPTISGGEAKVWRAVQP